MAKTRRRDTFLELMNVVSELKVTSRAMSDAMSDLADLMGAMSKSMAQMGNRMKSSERLYERLAKGSLACASPTEERFKSLEERVRTIESSQRLRSHH